MYPDNGETTFMVAEKGLPHRFLSYKTHRFWRALIAEREVLTSDTNDVKVANI